MSASRSALLSAAHTFLANGGPLALESAFASRAAELLRAFTAGELDAVAMRAAFAGEPRPMAPPSMKGTAVLELRGVLTPNESFFTFLGAGTSVRTFMRALAAAAADPAVKSIAIVVDSPGGQVRLIPEAATAVRAARTQKPVVVSVAGLNASAAYWLTSGATTMEATPSASIGAIGVVVQRPSVVRLLDKAGIDVAVIAAGKFKGEGDPATPLGDSERAHLQAQVDHAYGQFVDDVAAGRRVAASTVRSGFGEGRIVAADAAVRLHMIDRIATLDATIDRAISAPAAFGALARQRAELARLTGRGTGRDDLAAHRRELAAAREPVTR